MNKDGSVKMVKKVTIFKPNVVLIDRNVLADSELSLEAKGLYGTLMCLCMEYNDNSERKIIELVPEISESKIEELLDELIEAGYLNFKSENNVLFEEK